MEVQQTTGRDERNTEIVYVRLPLAQKDALVEAADAAGVSISEYVRRALDSVMERIAAQERADLTREEWMVQDSVEGRR